MPDIKISPFIKSIAIALIFYALGRLIVLQMGTNGIWLILGSLVIFYGWRWVIFRRNKGNKK